MTVDALVARARSAWPDVAVDGAGFARFVAARLGDGDAAALHVEDLYLVYGCVAGAPSALAAFERAFLAAVPHYLARIDRSPAFVDEVRQRLRERLLVGAGGAPPRLASYSGRGALASFLQVAAIRVALNLRRDQRGATPPEGHADAPMVDADPELRLLQQRFRRDFRAAFAEVVGALTVAERQLLRLHFVDGVSLGRIGALDGVDKSTVSRRLQAAQRRLLVETSRLLCARLGLPADELASLVRQVRSQLDLSLPRLLRSAPGG